VEAPTVPTPTEEAEMENPTATGSTTETTLDELRDQRVALRLRHAQALTSLMEERADLRGVHALADHFDEAVRWSA
jgi:hypothetical protein